MYVTSYGKVEIRTSNLAELSVTDHLAFGSGLYSFGTYTLWSGLMPMRE
jgi:hypothetical protein